jgi:hypothetical protein
MANLYRILFIPVLLKKLKEGLNYRHVPNNQWFLYHVRTGRGNTGGALQRVFTADPFRNFKIIAAALAHYRLMRAFGPHLKKTEPTRVHLRFSAYSDSIEK